MGSPRKLDKRRLDTIYKRQATPGFGPKYQPAILATREEAPSSSRPARIWSEMLGRDVHTLSFAEQCTVMLLLYHPGLFDLHEQRMLPPTSAPHPLHGHPLSTGMTLPAMRGTVLVADELGVLGIHPVVRYPVGEEVHEEPGCWVGDFLLFLRDHQGPYLINWTVKSTREEFDRPLIGWTPKRNKEKSEQREAARHLVERALYAEIGIPTHQIAADELDPVVIANLRNCLLFSRRIHSLVPDQVDEIIDRFGDGMRVGTSALEVMLLVERSEGFKQYDLQTVLHQAIWDRRLRVDLTSQHFFIDQPLQPERVDVLEKYGHLFAREAA